MLEKIKLLTNLIELGLIKEKLETLDDSLDDSLDAHVADCARYLREFNALEPKERFELLTTVNSNKKICWNVDAIGIAIYAIGHAYLVRNPESVADRTVDHMMVDSEPITIVTTPNGERLSFDNFPEFGEAHFSSYFPLHYEAALASKHIAMMCRGLGRIW